MSLQEPESEYLMDEDENIFLRNQVDAITRARYLLLEREPAKDYSISDVVKALAGSEERAQFMCGFVGLSQALEEVKKLKDYMVEGEYITLDAHDNIYLTDKGRARSSNPLPDEIESCF